MEFKAVRRIPLSILAGFSVLALATGSATAWLVWHTTPSTNTPAPVAVQPSPPAQSFEPPAVKPAAPAITTRHPKPQARATIEPTAQVYWLKAAGNKIELAPSSVKLTSAKTPDAVLAGAIDRLLTGTADSQVTTTIPENTQLRNVAVKPDGIHVNLSSAFTMGGGSASMTGRVAQIVYTATSLQPNAKVWISVEGKPLEVLGGEGLLIDQPLTRASFQQDFAL